MDERQPWHKLPEEDGTWYARFKSWLHQAKPRSVLLAYKEERARKSKKKQEKKAGRSSKEILTYPRPWHDAKERYRWAVSSSPPRRYTAGSPPP
jgi:hypothetical protein